MLAGFRSRSLEVLPKFEARFIQDAFNVLCDPNLTSITQELAAETLVEWLLCYYGKVLKQIDKTQIHIVIRQYLADKNLATLQEKFQHFKLVLMIINFIAPENVITMTSSNIIEELKASRYGYVQYFLARFFVAKHTVNSQQVTPVLLESSRITKFSNFSRLTNDLDVNIKCYKALSVRIVNGEMNFGFSFVAVKNIFYQALFDYYDEFIKYKVMSEEDPVYEGQDDIEEFSAIATEIEECIEHNLALENPMYSLGYMFYDFLHKIYTKADPGKLEEIKTKAMVCIAQGLEKKDPLLIIFRLNAHFASTNSEKISCFPWEADFFAGQILSKEEVKKYTKLSLGLDLDDPLIKALIARKPETQKFLTSVNEYVTEKQRNSLLCEAEKEREKEKANRKKHADKLLKAKALKEAEEQKKKKIAQKAAVLKAAVLKAETRKRKKSKNPTNQIDSIESVDTTEAEEAEQPSDASVANASIGPEILSPSMTFIWRHNPYPEVIKTASGSLEFKEESNRYVLTPKF